LVNASLSLEDIKTIMPPEFVKQLNNLYMCGNHGDPIFAPDCMDIFKYLRECNPNIHLSMITNGGAQTPEWWEELATIVNRVEFSIDGLEDTNHIYRVGVSWSRLEENLAAFCDAGGKAKWTYLVFAHNEHQVEEAERYSKLLGVEEFVLKKTSRFISTKKLKRRAGAKSRDRKGIVQQVIKEPTLEKYKNKEMKVYDKEMKDKGTLKGIYSNANIVCKSIKKKEIFISAEGLIHPCCWTANTMYKYWDNIGDDPIWEHIKHKDSINGKLQPIKDIVEGPFFTGISKTWDHKPVQVCSLKCNKEYDPYKAQWT